MSAIRYDKYLNILIEPTPRPEAITLVSLYLIECLLDRDTTPLEFHMHKRQSVDQYGDIVSIAISARLRILVHHLKTIVVDIALIDELHILHTAVIAMEHLHMIALNTARLFYDSLILVSDATSEEPLPLFISEHEAIQ